MTPFATLAQLVARHPAELVVLAADETTGERDDARIEAALSDASAEMRGILQARYTPTDLDALDETSREILAVYAQDIALYRVALSFSRSTERLKEAYENAIKRLEAIAAGKGGLTVVSGSSGPSTPTSAEDVGEIGPNGVVIDVPERIFTRDRFRRS
jgi:phage gp36-like protein